MKYEYYHDVKTNSFLLILQTKYSAKVCVGFTTDYVKDISIFL